MREIKLPGKKPVDCDPKSTEVSRGQRSEPLLPLILSTKPPLLELQDHMLDKMNSPDQKAPDAQFMLSDSIEALVKRLAGRL